MTDRACVYCNGRSLSPQLRNYLCAEHMFEFDHGVAPEEQTPQDPTWRALNLSEAPVG